jgi:hypothetical protein
VAALPPGFVHETLLVGGNGIGATADALGGALLARSGKPHVDAYGDFVLSHVGYWTVRFDANHPCAPKTPPRKNKP